MQSLRAGSQIDRYVVEALLGTGATGRVYRAFDTRLHRLVAFKVVDGGEAGEIDATHAAVREARAAAAVHHPGVAAVYDADCVEGVAFIVTELVRGTSMRDFVGDAAVDEPSRVRWLVDVAEALAAAHALGVAHRDVKLANVIVRDDGLIKILDFGVARPPRGPDEALLAPDGVAPGEPHALAVDAHLDQFGWGVLAYELLTGALPFLRATSPGHDVEASGVDLQAFPGPLRALMASLGDEPVAFPAGAPVRAEVQQVVLRALSRAPEARFSSMREIVDALSPYAAPPVPHSGSWSTPPAATPPSSKSSRPRADGAPESRVRLAPPPVPDFSFASPSPRATPQRRELGRLDSPAASSRRALAAPRSSATGPREPDFLAPVDLAAHLALLPPMATTKGMYVADLFQAARHLTPTEVRALAGVPERRVLPFGDYPMGEHMKMQFAVARALHRDHAIGEGLRRIGQRTFAAMLGSQIGKALFGVADKDAERLLLLLGRAHELTWSFGTIEAEKSGDGRIVMHARDMPTFLETYEVGVIEGVLRHCGRPGRVQIDTAGLADAIFDVALE